MTYGLTPGFLSKGICLHAKKAFSDPSFPHYLFKHNFFVMSATALQRSRLLSLMMMRLECDATHLHLSLIDLLLPWFHVQRYISGHRLILHMHILCIILRPCSKRSWYFGAPTGCFSLRRLMVFLVVGSIPALSVSERSLNAAFTFPDNIKLAQLMLDYFGKFVWIE